MRVCLVRHTGDVLHKAHTQNEMAKIGVTPTRGGPIPRYMLLIGLSDVDPLMRGAHAAKLHAPLETIACQGLLYDIKGSSICALGCSL
jgi:hypothetical protein